MTHRPGLNNDELQQLVKDLKAGKPWADVVAERCHVLAPGVLEASDYKAWAHREAGIELEAPPPAPAAEPVTELDPEEPEHQVDHRGKRGKR